MEPQRNESSFSSSEPAPPRPEAAPDPLPPAEVPALLPRDLLEAIEEFATASVELVAWEYDVPVASIEPIWNEMVAAGLLTEGTLDASGERIRALTPAGVAHLETLRAAPPS